MEQEEKQGTLGGIPIKTFGNSTPVSTEEASATEEVNTESQTKQENTTNTGEGNPTVKEGEIANLAETTKEHPDVEKIRTEIETEFTTKYADYDTLKQLSESKEKELNSLRQRFEEIAPKTEKYYKLSKLSETQPEKVEFFEKLLSGSMGQKDILREKIIEETGLKDDNKIDAILNKKYGYNLSPLEPLDAEIESEDDVKKRNQEIQSRNEDILYHEAIREQDAKAFSELKKSELDKIEYPKGKTAEDYENEQKEYLDTWKPLFKEDLSSLKEFSLNILNEKGESTNYMKVEIPEKELPNYLQYASTIIASTNIEATKENAEKIKELMVREYFWNNKEQILTDLVNKKLHEVKEAERKDTFNSDLDANKHTEIADTPQEDGGSSFVRKINGG